jgi:hypothetical protein
VGLSIRNGACYDFESSFGHIIDGEEVGSLDGATFDSVDPWLREPSAEIALGGKADAERAIAAARKAFTRGHGRAWASRSAARSCTGHYVMPLAAGWGAVAPAQYN